MLLAAPTYATDYTTMSLPVRAIARLGKGQSLDVKFSPDDKLLAVASSIGIWLYDADTYFEIALLTDHSDIATFVSFLPDGKLLALTKLK